jgi:molybdopterin-guanine dinucleotide biosynthesis protein A
MTNVRSAYLQVQHEAVVKDHNNVTAFVLAGGASRRMGRDKALLELNGVPMVVRMARQAEPHVASVTVVGPPERYAQLGLRVVLDRWPGAGPLGGILTALGASTSHWNLILGCDLPHLTSEWIEWLISRTLESPAQAIVPESRRGLEPLAAIYRKDCGLAFSTALKRGVRRVSEAVGEICFEKVTATEWRKLGLTDMLFHNMNTPGDFAKAQRRIRQAKMTP